MDKGKSFREHHQNRLVPLVSLFPFVLVLHRPSHVWISGMKALLEVTSRCCCMFANSSRVVGNTEVILQASQTSNTYEMGL